MFFAPFLFFALLTLILLEEKLLYNLHVFVRFTQYVEGTQLQKKVERTFSICKAKPKFMVERKIVCPFLTYYFLLNNFCILVEQAL